MKNLINTLKLTINADVELFGVTDITASKIEQAISNRVDLIEFVDKNSTAINILKSTTPMLSDSQLNDVAKALIGSDYHKQLIARDNRAQAIRDQEEAKRKNKLAANKSATQPVLDFVKSQGLKLGDYYKFLKANKKYSKEFYSKKYTQESAESFILEIYG